MTLIQAVAQRMLELCAQRGITQSTLNNIVNTGSNNPTVFTIKKVCDGLDITLAAFFDSPLFTALEQEVR